MLLAALRRKSGLGLGRVKMLESEEHVEYASSLPPMSSQAIARQLGNRGAGRTQIPSVGALSELLHTQGQAQTKQSGRKCVHLWSKAPPIAVAFAASLPEARGSPRHTRVAETRVCESQESLKRELMAAPL